jgi:hypothetical protein
MDALIWFPVISFAARVILTQPVVIQQPGKYHLEQVSLEKLKYSPAKTKQKHLA